MLENYKYIVRKTKKVFEYVRSPVTRVRVTDPVALPLVPEN